MSLTQLAIFEMTDSKIQPILCCVGDSVAGRPTQFLMERAFAAAHCDWRVITVEVATRDFATALAGMQAMRFAAIRFFPELQQAAAQLLVPDGFAAVDGVTSAMRKGDSWTCWDNIGFGLVKLICNQATLENSVIWLTGDSRLTRSLMTALLASEPSPAKLIWTDAPPGVAAARDNVEEPANNALPVWVTFPPLEEAPALIERFIVTLETRRTLVVVGQGVAMHLQLLNQLDVENVGLVIATNALMPRSEISTVWSKGPISILTESEQVIAAESYDFERWTEQSADIDLLRDAYDEYADF
jgi:hypothetical protein